MAYTSCAGARVLQLGFLGGGGDIIFAFGSYGVREGGACLETTRWTELRSGKHDTCILHCTIAGVAQSQSKYGQSIQSFRCKSEAPGASTPDKRRTFHLCLPWVTNMKERSPASRGYRERSQNTFLVSQEACHPLFVHSPKHRYSTYRPARPCPAPVYAPRATASTRSHVL